jgi:hypothetical protein
VNGRGREDPKRERRYERGERLTAERTDDASEPRLSLDASTGGSELGIMDVRWGGGDERVCAPLSEWPRAAVRLVVQCRRRIGVLWSGVG